MDISKLTKGIFALRQKPEIVVAKPEPEIREVLTYQDRGFHQARELGGALPGLKVCLQKIYREFREEVRVGTEKQEELKKPYRVKIEDYKGHNNNLEQKIEKIKQDDIPGIRQKIERFKQELSHIRQHPHEIIGDDAGKASFVIGSVILLFLTVYLFIFYSSASYSAFFKQFTLNDIGVTNSIFDAKALTTAWKEGFTELMLILTIPFAFLGLGYLIHKFQEQKGVKKYFQIAALVIITFLFDTILAYEITERIYDIKKSDSFEAIPDYSFSLAFHSISFWMIIFAGFIVYLIWGFVFDFTIEAYGKIDKLTVAIREKQKQITDAEEQLKDLDTQIDKMTHTINDNKREINKLVKIIDSTIMTREFEYDIFSFMSGWMAWMKGTNKTQDELHTAQQTVDEFIKVTTYSIETI